MGTAPHAPWRWPSAISRGARPPLVSSARVIVRLPSSRGGLPQPSNHRFLSLARHQVRWHFSAMGASRAIALAIGHLTRRVPCRTQQSTPVDLVRSRDRSAPVESEVLPIPVAVIFDFSLLFAAFPSAVTFQCHGHGASRAIALAIGHLARRASRRTHQSIPVGLVRSRGCSTPVDSGGSTPVAMIVDFSLLHAAKCGGVSVPWA